jgi:hypothetical protein
MATKVNVQFTGDVMVHAVDPKYPYHSTGWGVDLSFRTACGDGRRPRDSTPTGAEVNCMACLAAGLH